MSKVDLIVAAFEVDGILWRVHASSLEKAELSTGKISTVTGEANNTREFNLAVIIL
jgi:hypothetical protein